MKRTVRKFKETVEIQSSLLNRVRASRYLPIAGIVTVVLLASCVHIWQRVRVLDLVHRVSLLEGENRNLADEVRKVYSDVASLSMSSRIRTYAADTLRLETIPADRLFTLVPHGDRPSLSDDFDMVLDGFKRFSSYLPRVTETEANAGELRNPTIDSLARQEDGR